MHITEFPLFHIMATVAHLRVVACAERRSRIVWGRHLGSCSTSHALDLYLYLYLIIKNIRVPWLVLPLVYFVSQESFG
jgi:hypothetical protein